MLRKKSKALLHLTVLTVVSLLQLSCVFTRPVMEAYKDKCETSYTEVFHGGIKTLRFGGVDYKTILFSYDSIPVNLRDEIGCIAYNIRPMENVAIGFYSRPTNALVLLLEDLDKDILSSLVFTFNTSDFSTVRFEAYKGIKDVLRAISGNKPEDIIYKLAVIQTVMPTIEFLNLIKSLSNGQLPKRK